MNTLKIKKGDVLYPPFKGYKWGSPCVYRLNFKGGYFYIGSTVCICSRIGGHKINGTFTYKHPIKKSMMWKNIVSVEILRTGKDIAKLRRIEEKMITEIFKKIACVNMIRKNIR